MSLRTAIPIVALVAILAGPSAADVLQLRDGRIFEGRPMERTDAGIKVKFENGEVLVPHEKIQEAILESDATLEPQTDEEREQTAKGLVRFEGKWVTPKYRGELILKRIEERKKEIEEIRRGAVWRNHGQEKTRHFDLHYTVPPHIYEYYRDLLEAFFTSFAKTWKVKPFKDQPRIMVAAHINRKLFHRNSGAPYGALAYYRFVAPREIHFFYDRTDPLMTERAMFHEATHYLVDLIRHDFNMPHFPGEALAEFYGGSEFEPRSKKLKTGLVQESRLAQIKMDITAGEPLGLEKMITTDGMYQHYTWGWSLVHFCMNDKKLSRKFETYVKNLVSGRGVKQEAGGFGLVTVRPQENWRAFRAALGLKKEEQVKEFEAAWHEYVTEGLDLVTARALEQAAADADRSGMFPIKAKRLYKEAIDAGSTNPLTYHRYATILKRDGKRDQAIELWRKAIELDPLEGAFYLSLGKALEKGDEEESKKLIALAQEIDPSIDPDD